jgi:hypothetical protein
VTDPVIDAPCCAVARRSATARRWSASSTPVGRWSGPEPYRRAVRSRPTTIAATSAAVKIIINTM